jgi:hypothetical protein
VRKSEIIDGPVQREILRRARSSKMSMVYVKDYREMRAARALVQRGVLAYLGAPGSLSCLFVLRTSIEEFLK